MAIIIPLLTIEITTEFVKQGLETVSNLKLQQWKEEILGALIDLLRKSKLKMVISPRKRWISEIQRLRGLMTVFRSFAKGLMLSKRKIAFESN